MRHEVLRMPEGTEVLAMVPDRDLRARPPTGTVSGVRYRLSLPKSNGAEAVCGFIGDWIEQPALRRIVEAEGGQWPSGSLEERVDALHDFSARWDFRGGVERLEIDSSSIQDHDESLLADAAELGSVSALRML